MRSSFELYYFFYVVYYSFYIISFIIKKLTKVCSDAYLGPEIMRYFSLCAETIQSEK